MKQLFLSQPFALFILRIALSAGFLSAVAGRLGLWGAKSSTWKDFVHYTRSLNYYLPGSLIPTVATVATILETALGLLLLFGLFTRESAFGAAILTALFAISMSLANGIKDPLDYSVFAFSAGAWVLATAQAGTYFCSLDQLIRHLH